MKLFTATIVTVLTLTAVGVFVALSDTNEPTYEKRLQKIANEINSHDYGWKAKVSPRFKGMTKAEIKGMMGTLESESTLDLPHATEVQDLNLKDLPRSFSSEAKWPQCQSIKDIRDQANCGSCWAFGAASAISDRLCITGNTQETNNLQTRISAADLLACCTTCGFGCKGGYTYRAWEHFVNHGVVTGWNYGDKNFCYPYQFHPCTREYPQCQRDVATPACRRTCIPGYPKSYRNDKHYGSSVYQVIGEEVMMAELVKNGPFEVSYSVYEDFMDYESGVYHHEEGEYLGGHAVKLVGYGVDENGVKYWRLANSWTENWGIDGYFLFRRGKNDCGIESRAVAGLIRK